MDVHSIVSGAIGINFYHLVAGTAGGIVISIRKGYGIIKALPGTLSGALVAAYLTPVAVRYIPGPVDPSVEHCTAFVLGLTALVIVDGVMGLAERWRKDPKIPVKP